MRKNKTWKYTLFSVLSFLSFAMITLADDKEIDLCAEAGVVKSFQIIGYGLIILKILIPLILIIIASVELGKAVISSDDKAIKAAINSIIKKAIAGVVIFFVPTIVSAVMKLVDAANGVADDFSCLPTCISDPGSCVVPDNDLFQDCINNPDLCE